MRKREFFASIVVSLIAGSSLILILLGDNLSNVKENSSVNTSAVTPAPVSSRTSISLPEITSTPASHLIEEGDERGPDFEDILLLYDPNRPSSFDTNFCKIADYYGLLCKMIAVDITGITDQVLRDSQGTYYELVGIDAANFLKQPSLFTETEIEALKSAISIGGINILISRVNNSLEITGLSELTDGAISGSTRPPDNRGNWIVSSGAPEITREFSGQVITPSSTARQDDFSLLLAQPATVETLISSKGNDGTEYPIFVRWQKGTGSIFIDSGGGKKSLDKLPLREMYYDESNFSSIAPIMLAMRYAAGEEAWHNDHNYANLTIDDPTLSEPYYELSYPPLLQEMEVHNFHTTIALIPAKWQRFNLDVVSLFQLHPDRYSLVQHGNNHDGYEFFKYDLTANDPQDDPNFRARPLTEQEDDIVEGLFRMGEMSRILDIPFDQVMIFPYGISPESTLVLLKKYNYLATVNAQDVPLDAARPSAWDYGMYPAEMSYGNFATLSRRHPGTYLPFQPNIQPFIFDLFIDKPALFYSHAYGGEIFAEGMDGFDGIADHMNSLYGQVEWRSLGYILTHLFLEKRNDDGSIDVRMYGNDLVVKNESASEQSYHFSKDEILNVPIVKLTVNDQEFHYYIENELLKLDARIPANTSVEIYVQYGD